MGLELEEFIEECRLMTRTRAKHLRSQGGLAVDSDGFVAFYLAQWLAKLDNPDSSALVTYLSDRDGERFLDGIMVLSIVHNIECHFPMLWRRATNGEKVAVVHAAIQVKSIVFIRHIVQAGLPWTPDLYIPPLLFQLTLLPEALVGFNVNYNTIGPGGGNVCHYIAKSFASDLRTSRFIFVIQRGADPCSLDCRGQTPWDLCTMRSNRVDLEENLAVLFLAGVTTYHSHPQRFETKTESWQLFRDELCNGVWSTETKAKVRSAIDMIIVRTGVSICAGLQAQELPALVLCEILQAYFCMWPRIPFHHYWNLAVAVKHFRERQTGSQNQQ